MRLEALPRLEQRPVPGRLDDRLVEGRVCRALGAWLSGGPHVPYEPRETIELRVADALGGEARGQRLERRADGERLEQVFDGDVSYPASAEWLGVDEAELFEIAQRLSHRSLADAQLLRDARLHEPAPRRVDTREDSLEQDLLDLLAQDDAGQRSAHVALNPPSMSTMAPVIHPARGEARKAIAPPTS